MQWPGRLSVVVVAFVELVVAAIVVLFVNEMTPNLDILERAAKKACKKTAFKAANSLVNS